MALPGWVVDQFDAPPTGTTLDHHQPRRAGRPGELGGREECEVGVLVDDEPVVSAGFTTWRAP